MYWSRLVIPVLMLIVLPFCGYAQILDTLPVQRPSALEGTHYYIGYMENEISIQPSGLRLRLLITSAYPNRVTIEYPDGSQKLYQLGAYQTLPLLLPDTLEVRQSETPLRRAVEIRSELPISVFAMSSQYTTSDSYAALPVDMWGTEYTVFSLPNDTYGDGAGSAVDPADIRQSEFMIIASVDQTLVEFMPTSQTEAGRAANVWHRVVLNRGECYLVKSYPSPQGTGDLTATMIRANKPIGVLSGHVRASVPIGLPQTLDSKDHLVEMLLPNNLLGSSYVTVPFATGARLPMGDYLRAVAILPDTRITVYTERDDLSFVLANAGDTLTLPRVNSPSWWFANKPFALVQYMTTATIANSITFDPAMVLAVPSHLYVSRCIFQAPANLNDATFSRQFDRHWLNVICDEKARTSLRLDGKRVIDSIAPELATQKFRSSSMFWAQIPISPGMHILETDSGSFTGALYGMGYTDSYAHIIGVTNVTRRDTIVPSLSVRDSCAWLIGRAYDMGGSGIAFVAIDPDSTKNYDLHIITKDSTSIAFRAALVDPYQDGAIAIIVRDGAGNGIRYRYTYRAPVVDLLPRPLQLQATRMGEVVCRDVTIRNFSFRDTLWVNSLYFSQGGSGVFRVQTSTLPLVCPPRREASVQLCYTATVEGTRRDTLIWDLGCGRTYRSPIEARTPRPDLSTWDLDFGEVAVGDTVCKPLLVVNTGTELVRIEQLLANPPTSSFQIQQTTLPKTLQPGDTLQALVCFVPTDTGAVWFRIAVGNDKGLPTSALVRGRGIRAELIAYTLECGPQRVGVRFDTAARIINRGSADAEIRFVQQIGDADAVLHSLAAGDRLRIPRGSSIGIPIRFSPQRVGSVTSVLEFATADSTPVRLLVTGNGTMPQIAMADTTIGPVKRGQRGDYIVAILRAGGNEALTVDSLWFDGPDRNAFRIGPLPSMPIVVSPGEAVEIPVVFEPARVGMHQVRLFAKNDARPNYLRTISEGQLRGLAIAPDSSGGSGGENDTTAVTDTLNFRLDVEFTPNPLRCEPEELLLIAQNTGNIPLYFTSAYLLDGGQPVNILNRLPMMLDAGDATRIRIVIPPPQTERTITIRIVANDTLLRERSFRIIPQGGQLMLDIEPVEGTIDSTVDVHFSGSLRPGRNVPQTMMLDIEVPPDLVEYRGSVTLPVLLRCDRDTLTTQATIALGATRYGASWTVPSFVTDCQWQLAIPVRLLYSLVTRGVLRARATLGECYDDATAEATVTTNTVCGHQLRGIQLVGASIQSVTPNPFSDYLQLDVDVFRPLMFSAWAYDGSGKKFYVGQSPLLHTGRHVVIFDTDTLPSGWFIIVLESSDGRSIELCCLFKP